MSTREYRAGLDCGLVVSAHMQSNGKLVVTLLRPRSITPERAQYEQLVFAMAPLSACRFDDSAQGRTVWVGDAAFQLDSGAQAAAIRDMAHVGREEVSHVPA